MMVTRRDLLQLKTQGTTTRWVGGADLQYILKSHALLGWDTHKPEASYTAERLPQEREF